MNNKDISSTWETMKKLRSEGKLSIPTQQDIENEPTALAFTYNDSEQNYFITVFGRKIIIKYVHQLQNLYHALTGEELTIKDEVY